MTQSEPEFLCRMDAGDEHLLGTTSCKGGVSLELPGAMVRGDDLPEKEAV